MNTLLRRYNIFAGSHCVGTKGGQSCKDVMQPVGGCTVYLCPLPVRVDLGTPKSQLKAVVGVQEDVPPQWFVAKMVITKCVHIGRAALSSPTPPQAPLETAR